MTPPDKDPWEERDPWEPKVPLGTRLVVGLLRAAGGAADLPGKRGRGRKGSTALSFGFGGPLITRDTCSDERVFTFRILGAQAVEGRGTAVYGMVSHGEVRAGDTVTCVTAGGRRFPCAIREVERPIPTGPHISGTQAPPFRTLFVIGRGPEEFHPQDKFIIEK